MNFGLKVANYVLRKNLLGSKVSNSNVVCSPLSIDTVLNIIALGSKGPTLNQILKLSGCNDIHGTASMLASVGKESKGDLELSSLNALWVDQRYPLKDSFQTVLRDLHRAQARSVDLRNKVDETVQEVNSWARKQSGGFIDQIISRDAIQSDSTMLLVNALYFKGTWVDRFKRENTQRSEFYLLNGSTIRVPFVNKYSTRYDYGTFEGCQVIKLPYKDENKSPGSVIKKARKFSMYIFLPEKKDGLSELLDKLHDKDYSSLLKEEIDFKYVEINKLSLPKFDFNCELPLVNHMKHLGLTLPFDLDCQDLTEIVDDLPSRENIYVSNIIQKCRVLMDEDGTKAVAFTWGLKGAGCGMPIPKPQINFIADHPFMFMIREDCSGAILFIGTMLNPSTS